MAPPFVHALCQCAGLTCRIVRTAFPDGGSDFPQEPLESEFARKVKKECAAYFGHYAVLQIKLVRNARTHTRNESLIH